MKENKKPQVKKKAGRPTRDFEPAIFEQLCFVQCTKDEMELILRTDQRVISKWCQRHYGIDFDTAYKRFSAGGKSSLRRDQYKLSKKNASMAIWLGKQWLGQRDIPQETEEFNGKLAALFDVIKEIKTEKDFQFPKLSKDSNPKLDGEKIST
jgi:hypothetical protein